MRNSIGMALLNSTFMMKKLTFYAFILTVFISSYNGLSREVNNPNPLLTSISTNTYDYQPLRKYVSLRPGYEIADLSHSNFRQIFGCLVDFTVNVDAGTCGAVVTWIEPTTSDNSVFTITQTSGPTRGSFFPLGQTTVIYTETDTTEITPDTYCSFVITVEDNEAPTLTPAADQNVNLDTNCEITIPDVTGSSTDNCGTASITQLPTAGSTIASSHNGTVIVTVTATDTSGNTDVEIVTLTALDNIPPTPDVAILADLTDECSVNALTAPTATDNCGGTVTVTHNATLPISTQGTTLVTWTYADTNGNTSIQTQNVVITHNTAPIADVTPLDDVIAQCEVTALTPPTATDNCTTVTVTNNATLPISAQGTTLVTWTYADTNGNTSTQTQNVVITDNTAPIADVTPLDDVIAQCEVTALTPPTATDNCGGTITGTTTTTLPVSTQGPTLITWTYDDGNGNASTQTQNVVITDTTDPIIPSLADVTVGQCSGTPLAPTTTDNCAGTITGTTSTTFPITAQGLTVVTWTFDDGNGNVVTADQNVTVNNTTLPNTPTLADVTGECTATATIPTTTDNCGASITGTTTDPLTYNTQGSFIITWTFDDGNGNSITVGQNVIIDDITPPAIPTLADVIGQCTATATVPTTTDNCGATITGTTTDPLTYNTQGTHTITWNFNDGHGNSITVNQNVIIDDITAPVPNVATLPNITAECSATLVAPTATDNCSGTLTATSTDPLTYNTQGTYTVNWTYDDGHGNMSTQTQTVIIDDVSAPVFTSCPSSVSRNNDIDTCGAVVNYTIPTATDNCGTATVVQTDTTGLTSGSLFPIGTTTLEYTATDDQGISSICSFTITITDSEIPTIICPPAVTVNADANCEATSVTLGTPTTNDNCGVATVTNDLAGQLPLPVGTHTITWTVEDTAGLTATCTQQVTVVDVTPPVITCPIPSAFYNTDAGQCTASLSFNATATDNCNGSPLISYEIGGTPVTFPYTFSLGTTNVVVISDDGNGLSSTCNFDVVVEDHEAPTAICQPITVTLDASGNANIVASDLDNGSFDNCSS